MKALSCVFILTALASGHAYAACSYPKAPEKPPDGASATLQEMLDAQKAVKAYNDEIKAYTDCLKLEYNDELTKAHTRADADKLTKDQRTAMEKQLESVQIEKNNAAVDEAQAVTNRFNEQVRVFRQKNQKSKT